MPSAALQLFAQRRSRFAGRTQLPSRRSVCGGIPATVGGRFPGAIGVVLTSAGAHKRLRPILTAAILLLCMLTQAQALAATANPGGASAPGGANGGAPAGKAPAKGSAGKGGKPASSLHVTTVRITSVHCIPLIHCSAKPHQVSLHGILEIAGKGLAAGMVVAFPSRPRARISSTSPAGHLRKGSAGLEVTVPKSAHSGNIMVLLGHGRFTSSYGPIT